MTTPTPDLLNCRYCGGEPLEDYLGGRIVACRNMKCRGSHDWVTPDQWNTRRAAPSPAPTLADGIAALNRLSPEVCPRTNDGKHQIETHDKWGDEHAPTCRMCGLEVAAPAPAPEPITKMVAEQQDCPAEFNAVFAKRHMEMLAADLPAPPIEGDDNCPVCGFPPPPEPTQEHRERAEAWGFNNSLLVTQIEELASEFAAVADEAYARGHDMGVSRAYGESVPVNYKSLQGYIDEATKAERNREAEAFLHRTANGVKLDAEPTPEQLASAMDFIEKHWPGMDVMRGTVWHADACAVIDAATKAETERCARVCDDLIEKIPKADGEYLNPEKGSTVEGAYVDCAAAIRGQK